MGFPPLVYKLILSTLWYLFKTYKARQIFWLSRNLEIKVLHDFMQVSLSGSKFNEKKMQSFSTCFSGTFDLWGIKRNHIHKHYLYIPQTFIEYLPCASDYWRRRRKPTPVFLPGKSHGQRSLVAYSPWGHKELDTTEQLHFHFTFTSNYKWLFKMMEKILIHYLE